METVGETAVTLTVTAHCPHCGFEGKRKKVVVTHDKCGEETPDGARISLIERAFRPKALDALRSDHEALVVERTGLSCEGAVRPGPLPKLSEDDETAEAA